MANRFWVGGTGTWDATTTTNWSATTGGAGGASAPTSADNVIIDTASGTGTITCTAGVCADLTVTATQAIILGASASTLSVYGNLTFPATGSFSASTNSWGITFAATTTGKIITTNGKSFSAVTFNGVGGGWTLGSALGFAGSLTLTNGTLDTSSTGNYSLTGGSSTMFLGTGTKTLNLNASTFTISSLNFVTGATGFTFNAGTSTVLLNGATFQPNTYSFYNVTYSSPVGDGIKTLTLTTNLTVTGTLTLGTANTAVRRQAVVSDVIGTQRTITAATVATLSDVDFRDIAFSTSQTGTRLGNCGGNSNITFPAAKTVYWAIASGGFWGVTGTAIWATGSSSGTPDVNNFPLAQDTAVIDSKPNAGLSIAINVAWNIGTVNLSARTTALTFTFTSGFNLYGNWITGIGVTYTGIGAITFAGRTTQQLTSAGIAFTNPITIAGVGNTVQLQDAFTTASTNTVTLTQGTLDLNNYNFTCGIFSSNVTNTRSILFGTGQIYLTGFTGNFFLVNGTGLTLAGSKIVNCTSTTSTGIRTWQITAGFTESNCFNFNVTAGSDTLQFNASAVINNLDLTGFSGTLGNGGFTIYGNLKLSPTMTTALPTGFNFSSTTQQQNITSAGKSIESGINCNGTQIVKLQDALTLGSTRTLTLTSGTFDANNYNVTTGLFSSANLNNVRTLNMGSGTWTILGSGTSWSASNNTNFTVNRGTSTISFTSASAKTFQGGTGVYWNVANQGAGILTWGTGGNTVNNISCVAGSGITFTSNVTVSANSLTLVGTPSAPITIAPSSTTNYTLTKLGGGIVDMQNVSISRCTATPSTGTWYAGASTDGGNNTGIRFVSAPKFQQMF